MRLALAVALAIVVAAAMGGEPRPDFAIDWDDVEHRIQARWPSVVAVEHDPVDDFVTVVVDDGTDAADAAEASCATVLPIVHDAGSRALFAVYTRSGSIITSWNRCTLVPPTAEP